MNSYSETQIGGDSVNAVFASGLSRCLSAVCMKEDGVLLKQHRQCPRKQCNSSWFWVMLMR